MTDADAIRLVHECIAILRPIAEKREGCHIADNALELMDRLEAAVPLPSQHWLYEDEVAISAEAIRLMWRGVEDACREASWRKTRKKGKRVLAICVRLRAFLDECRGMEAVA